MDKDRSKGAATRTGGKIKQAASHLLAPAASPPIQRGRRLIGCTPRGGRPHEKAPRSGGAKVDHEGVAEMQKRATSCGLTLAWVAAFIQSHAPSSSAALS